MNTVFILDDNRRNALQLSQCLQAMGAFTCIALDSLADFRRQSRHCREGVVLVELVQSRSNGFELAAALLHQSRFPVILISSRGLPADSAWAKARGIQHIVERRQGLCALLACINNVLQGAPVCTAIAEAVPEPLLPTAVQHFVSAADTPEPDTQLAAQRLRTFCVGLWRELITELKPVTEVSSPWPVKAEALWQQLCSLLVFLQIPVPAAELRSVVVLGAELEVAHVDHRQHSLLVIVAKTLCRQAMQTSADWRRLLQLTLLIRTLTEAESEAASTEQAQLKELCIAIEDVAIPCLYGPPPVSSATKTAVPAQDGWQQVVASVLIQLPALDMTTLEHWHVSIYQLRSWLDCYIEISTTSSLPAEQSVRAWSQLISVLYNILSHLLLPLASGLRRSRCPPDLCAATAELVMLAADTKDLVPSHTLMRRLMALELSPAVSIPVHQRTEQQLLAAGLCLLSRPAQLLGQLVADHQQAGTLLVELRHELRLLLEGARRWKVVHVESLVTLMTLCYQRIDGNPQLLGQRRWRLILGRAHRHLCRLLDHAAVWQTPVRKNEASRYNRLLDDLFLLLDPEQYKDAQLALQPGVKKDWQHCLRFNRRIRLLMQAQQREQIDCSTLIQTLVAGQHKLLQQHVTVPSVV